MKRRRKGGEGGEKEDISVSEVNVQPSNSNQTEDELTRR